jgi:hypothetical protein
LDIIMPATIIQVEEGTHRSLGETRAPQTRDEWMEAVGANQRAGATGVQVTLSKTASVDQFLERIEWFAREVMPAFRR